MVIEILVSRFLWWSKHILVTTRFTTTEMALVSIAYKFALGSPRCHLIYLILTWCKVAFASRCICCIMMDTQTWWQPYVLWTLCSTTLHIVHPMDVLTSKVFNPNSTSYTLFKKLIKVVFKALDWHFIALSNVLDSSYF
jgi:hypothetical protein